MKLSPPVARNILLPLGAASVLLLAPGAARGALPPEAQSAVEQGLSAVQNQDFALASQCFQNARAIGPAAEVAARLGHLEAKVPGRELRAICWLGAYLAARPTAPDTVAVKSEIDDLQAGSRARILALIQSAEEAAQPMLPGEARDHALQGIASLWEEWGDEPRAQKTIDLIAGKGPKSDALSTLASAYAEKGGKQFEAGDSTGARESLASAQSAVEAVPWTASKTYPRYRIAMAHLVIARQQVRAGDLPGARDTIATAQEIADSTSDWYSEAEGAVATAELGLGRRQLQSGDAAGAVETFALARKMAALVSQPSEGYDLLMDLADAQTKASDLVGARASLAAALPLVTVYNDAGHARMAIVRAQVKAGDLAAAQATADLITEGPPSWRYDARRAVAEGQIKAGDLEGARKSLAAALAAVGLYEANGQGKFEAQRLIADAQVRADDAAGAMTTLAVALKTADVLFSDTDQKAWALQGIAEAQCKAGSQAVALQTASLIQNADIRSKTLRELAGSPGDLPSIVSEPMEWPRPSEILGSSPQVGAETWLWLLQEKLDAPCFTAYPNFSDVMLMADQILRTPVRHGMQQAYHPLDKVSSLLTVGSRVVAAQRQVDETLRLQFRK